MKQVISGVQYLCALAIAAYAGAITTFIVWFSVVGDGSLAEAIGNWGLFGDFVGGLLNPLVSIATLLIVAMAYLTQKQELTETVKALSHSATEQERLTQVSLLHGHPPRGLQT